MQNVSTFQVPARDSDMILKDYKLIKKYLFTLVIKLLKYDKAYELDLNCFAFTWSIQASLSKI